MSTFKDLSEFALQLLQVGLALLLIIFFVTVIAWLMRRSYGTAIFAFDVLVIGSDKEQVATYNGKSIADSLRVEMARIKQMCDYREPVISPVPIDPKSSKKVRAGTENNRVAAYGRPGLTETFRETSENSQTTNTPSLADAVTISLNKNSISIGRIVLACKELWRDRDPKIVISGSLHRFGASTRLVARVEHRHKSKQDIICEVSRSIDCDDHLIDMCRDLTFKIWDQTAKHWQEAPPTNAKTWQGFKHFTEITDQYNWYLLTRRIEFLDKARNACFEAIQAEQAHEALFVWCYRLGCEYYGRSKDKSARKLFSASLNIYDSLANPIGESSELLISPVNARTEDRKNSVEKDQDFAARNLSSYSNASRYLGVILSNVEEFSRAITIYENLIRLCPENPEYHNELGLIYYKLYRRDQANDQVNDQALQEILIAIHLKPDFASAHNNCGLAYERKGDTNRALKQYHQAIKFDPNLTAAYCNIALIHVKQKEINEAINKFKKADELTPNESFISDWLGYLYARQGHLDKALNALKVAVKVDSKDRRKRAALADIYHRLGRDADFEKQRDICMKMTPQDTEDNYIKACIEVLCGNTDEALELLEVALKDKKRTPEYARNDSDFDSIRNDPRFIKLVGDKMFG